MKKKNDNGYEAMAQTYAPYQQRLFSLRDFEVYNRKNTIFLIMKIYFWEYKLNVLII